MAEPTDEQLKEYAESLPDVYRAVLDSYVQYNSNGYPLRRRGGTMLTLETIEERMMFKYSLFRSGDTEEVLDRLIAKGFVMEVVEPIIHYKPTALGERLITALTGGEFVPENVPELPDLVWA